MSIEKYIIKKTSVYTTLNGKVRLIAELNHNVDQVCEALDNARASASVDFIYLQLAADKLLLKCTGAIKTASGSIDSISAYVLSDGFDRAHYGDRIS